MSERLPVPHFDPGGRSPGRNTERRQRLLVLAGGALVLALVASSIANATRASLRCEEGRLVPYRGRVLPVGEEVMNDAQYPVLRVDSAACEDEEFEDRDAFERRYVELAVGRADQVIQSDQQDGVESAIGVLEALPTNGGEDLQDKRRTLLERGMQEKVEQARESQQEALRWIERARRAGVDPAALRAAERSLGLTESPDPSPQAQPTAPPPEPPVGPEVTEPSTGSRAL